MLSILYARVKILTNSPLKDEEGAAIKGSGDDLRHKTSWIIQRKKRVVFAGTNILGFVVLEAGSCMVENMVLQSFEIWDV